MEKYRCKNPKCFQPVLFEGEFVGTVKKICPKCKEMNTFKELDTNKLKKICSLVKK
jgi:phage FluMu protein Com